MSTNDIEFRLGHDEIVLRKRYEIASIGNDILIAVWFAIGSVLFFFESTTTAGTWLFLLGSLQLLIRPALRMSRHVHIRRVGAGAPVESSSDF